MIDYNPSHSQLLFRKHKLNARDLNIDILFKGVYYITVPVMFVGLNIYEVSRKSEPSIVFNVAERKNLLKLADRDGNIFFIDASAVGIFNNSLEFTDSSIGNDMNPSENKLVEWIIVTD